MLGSGKRGPWAARREFEVLEGIDHSGMLRCRDLKETGLGPALIFDHDPRAVRLDHLMLEHGGADHHPAPEPGAGSLTYSSLHGRRLTTAP